MHIPTLLSQAHKTWPKKGCSQNVIKRKLWRPALCHENIMSYLRISLVLMASVCCKKSKTVCLTKKQSYVVAALCCRNI